MRKLLTALVAAASPRQASALLEVAIAAAPMLAVVGSAIASRPYYYPYGYYGYGPNPYYGPPCARLWNGYAWVPAC